MIPIAAPLTEILRNSKLFAPMVVLATFNAAPVVLVRVFTTPPVAAGLQGFSSQTFTVPPPVAVKAALAPELIERAPLKVMVLPVLFVKLTPAPAVSVMEPL